MHLSILVTNQAPPTDNNVPQPLLELFQEYSRQTLQGQVFPLFQHQADVFRRVEADEEVFLVAGTAAGKTLAISVPLFHKLAAGRIRRILLMYPTIALMEDQRRVMDGLARITGLQIGLIQGGMSRTELIAALGKPVILATPDAVYWFFRKNVKYNSLLIYGLALIDEFVLDEAHLFNGLMLQNLARLKERVQLLAERLGKRARWHILTATPTPELRTLTQGGEVQGQSKCSDVMVAFHQLAQNHTEYIGQVEGAITAALADDAKKVLVVFNAADTAHRVFERIRDEGGRVDLPGDLLLRFGRVRWDAFEQWLAQEEAIEQQTIEEIRGALLREHPPYLEDLARGVRVTLSTETFMRCASEQVERYRTAARRLIAAAAQDEQRDFLPAVEARLRDARGELRSLWQEIARRGQAATEPPAYLGLLDTWAEDLLSALERVCADEQFAVTAPAFPEIQAALQRAGSGASLAAPMTRALAAFIAVSEQDAAHSTAASHALARRLVSFSWLPQVVGDPARTQTLEQRLVPVLDGKLLHAEARHIAAWGDTRIPVIVYTGKMTKAERDGLIAAFARLDRAVLVSTPAVEVGVDFAADMLITEECDGNAFLQRFGRVGRRTGIQGRVVVFLKHQDTLVLLNLHPEQMTRGEFSDLIAHPVTGLFPRRTYTERSLFVDVVHYLVNEQVGEVGGWLNQRMFGAEVADLARAFQDAGLSFSYGLRSTLPGISLQSGAGGGEPLYILRKVENKDLLPSDSPFEMARSEMPYLEFLWAKPTSRAIAVDTRATLEASQALIWWQEDGWHARAVPGIASDYARLHDQAAARGGHTYEQLLGVARPAIMQDIGAFLRSLGPLASKPIAQLLLRVGEALPLYFEPHGRLILGQGSVYLRRLLAEGYTDVVEDGQGNQLPLLEQCWLLLLDDSREQAREKLRKADCLGLEEAVYIWQTCELADSRGLFLLDRLAGACFAIYQRLVAYALRQV